MKLNTILKYKIRFILIIIIICFFLFFALNLLKKSFSSYVSDGDIVVNSKHAIYVFEEDDIDFSVNIKEIVPRNEAYIYEFDIMNYNDKKRSDVDIKYNLSIITTTNLPLKYELYKDESYLDSNSKNIIDNEELIQDSDDSWYKKMSINQDFIFYHTSNMIDKYYLVVYFKASYADFPSYGGVIENIEINIKSEQIIE